MLTAAVFLTTSEHHYGDQQHADDRQRARYDPSRSDKRFVEEANHGRLRFNQFVNKGANGFNLN